MTMFHAHLLGMLVIMIGGGIWGFYEAGKERRAKRR